MLKYRLLPPWLFASFGPDGLMFGSDWPVCLLAGSYGRVIEALRRALGAGLTAETERKIFGETAVRFYGLRRT